jgi:hypothetical protein
MKRTDVILSAGTLAVVLLAVALVFGANLSRRHYVGADRPRVQ